MILTEESIRNGVVFLVDKPLEWTSFQVVNKIRWLLRKNFGLKKIKVGHAGTLDPLATGLLIICCGKKTKEISTYQGQEKSYTGTFLLGATTPSYDLETPIDQEYPIQHIHPDNVAEVAAQFEGEILQTPPVYSALKKDGKRLYDYARAGEEVSVPQRKVIIHHLTIASGSFPQIDFEVKCSKGTYIRSLAHDIGRALKSGAHLTSLRRIQIGDSHVREAFSMEDLEKIITDAAPEKDQNRPK